MNILRKSRETLDKKDLYFLCETETEKMSDVDEIKVTDWIIGEDVDRKTGEIHKVIVVKTPDNRYFGSNSPTFIESFETIVECFGDDFHTVEVLHKKNNSRTFIQARYKD